jgi:dihydropyrimidine dehydrogenase (NAD+) subunit PreT
MKHAVPPLSPEEFARNFAEIHPPLAKQEAAVEANRCLFCFDAPCTAACPTHIDVPRFIKKIATGNLRGSAITILDSNILGLSCSRVCPVDVLCEGACVMHRYNKQPIEIARLQRHAMDYFYENGGTLPAPRTVAGHRVACIGGGPASLACAAELRRHGVAVTIFEAREMAGGLNTYGIAEYKLRPPDSLKEVELVRSLGVEFRLGVEVGAGLSVERLEGEYRAIFIGVGLGPTHPLGAPGENLAGVVDAVRFIAEYKTGAPAVGRRVVVIGGGNTAIDAATAARRLGSDEVYILYRRGEHEMPAFHYEYELAKQDGIRFHWLTQPIALHGQSAVESVECVRMQLGPPDRTGRRRPQPVEGSNFRIACDMVVTSIGQSKLIDFLRRCRGIELSEGRVVVDSPTSQTANPRYFAGGDCVNGGREVVDAVAEGTRAARGIVQWLERTATA